LNIELVNVSAGTIDRAVRFTGGLARFTNGKLPRRLLWRAVRSGEESSGSPPLSRRLHIAGTFTGRWIIAARGLRCGTDDAIANFTYDDHAWPDGRMATGRPGDVDPLVDPNNPDNGRSSTEFGGRPRDGPAADRQRRHQRSAHAHRSTTLDVVELYNPTGAAIDLSGWYLSGGQSDGVTDGLAIQEVPHPQRHDPAAGAVPGLDEDDFNPTPQTASHHFSFNSAEGDEG
jgi:hypothetical protein